MFSLRVWLTLLALAASLLKFEPVKARPYDLPSKMGEVIRGNLVAALDEYLSRAAAYGFSGAVLVAKDGHSILQKGYGWSNKKEKRPVTAHTIFDTGSITKIFTATAIMQLEDRGELSTSDSINKYFRAVPKDKVEITLHQLLTHTAGLDELDDYAVAEGEDRKILTDRDLYVERILSMPLLFQPGKQFLYSNSGFSFLAAIIEKVSGKSYEEFLRENIFRPSGMLNTAYQIPRRRGLVAHGYGNNIVDYGPPWDRQWGPKGPGWDLIGNGGLLSTVGDLYKWDIALRGEQVLSQKAKEKMFKVHLQARPELGQGYAWRVLKTRHGTPVIGHSGDAVPFGWNSDYRRYVNDGLVVIVLTNKRVNGRGLRHPIIAGIDRIIFKDNTPELPSFISIKETFLRRYTGRYRLESGAELYVEADGLAIDGGRVGKQLTISGSGQEAIGLLFSSNPNELTVLEDFNARARAFIEAVRKKDVEAVKSFLPEGWRAQRFQEVFDSWRVSEDQKGPFQGYEIIGTTPVFQGTGRYQTYVRLDFKRSSAVYRGTWFNKTLSGINDDRLQPFVGRFLKLSPISYPATKSFMPQSISSFVSYDLHTSKVVRISFRTEKGGRVKELAVHTMNRDVVAQRVESTSLRPRTGPPRKGPE